MIAVLASLFSAAFGALVMYVLNRKASGDAARLLVRREAATALVTSMRPLREAVWDATMRHPIDGRHIAHLAISFEKVAMHYEPLLPRDARHLQRSGRAALSNLFGAPGAAALWPKAAVQPIDPIEPYWADISLTWFEHAERRLRAWYDSPGAKRIHLIDYYRWRKDEDAHHFASAR